MSVPSYPFHSLSLKLSNKRMDFSFPPLKLPNKGREEYSKMILFIPFHSLLPSGAWNVMVIREWKGMEWNGMYLSKGKEWKRMEWNGIK